MGSKHSDELRKWGAKIGVRADHRMVQLRDCGGAFSWENGVRCEHHHVHGSQQSTSVRGSGGASQPIG